MKRIFAALAAAAVLVGCSGLEERLEKVEDGVSQIENRLDDLEERLRSLESGVYITSYPKSRTETATLSECPSP